MTRKISLFILLFSVLKVVVSQFGCNVNEYFNEDVNPCNTCEIRGFCPLGFGPGCDCFPGYLRNSFGICGPPEVCDGSYSFPFVKEAGAPPRCKGHFEVYRDCGSACPPTCENRNRVCPAVCTPGCFCRLGYIRNEQGVCVRPDQCGRVPPKVPYEPSIIPRNNRYAPPPPYYAPPARPYPPVTVPKPPPVQRPVIPYRAYPPVVVPKPPPPPPQLPPLYKVNPPVVVPEPPPVLPPPPPVPPPRPPPRPPTDNKGCPNRVRCNRHCKSSGFAVGFCVSDRFLKCNCMG